MIENDRHNQNSRAPDNDSSDDKIDAREREELISNWSKVGAGPCWLLC